MKSSRSVLLVLLCLAGLSGAAQQFVPAQPGYRYQFPRDHFDHPDYQTEWWYYTGNLRTKDGRRFGFELTFFRQGISREPNPSPWFVHDIYMAHLALSDVTSGRYYKAERINRAGPGIAGISAVTRTVSNGNWSTVIGGRDHHLRGIGDGFSIDLIAAPQKAPVTHGIDGISQKAAGEGHASHYISFTSMATAGTVELQGKTYTVEGDTWMDHEFFTERPGAGEVGWDWLSVQLADHSELMLYRLRHADGSVDPYSSGTFVDARGQALHLTSADFTLTPAGTTWKSPSTSATYPLAWTIGVPRLQLQLAASTPLKTQEFVSRYGPSYWEGAIDVTGSRNSQPIRGEGYLEMTGYSNGRSPLIPDTRGSAP